MADPRANDESDGTAADPADTVEAVDDLLAVDVSALNDEGVRLHLLALHRARDRVEGSICEATASFVRRGLHHADGGRSPAGWLAGRVEATRGRCARDVRTAPAISDIPAVLEAWKAGRIGRDKALALHDVRTPEVAEVFDEQVEDLVEGLAPLRVDQAARYLRGWHQRARLYVGWIDPDDDVDSDAPTVRLDLSPTVHDRWVLDAEMDGDHGRQLKSILDAEVDEMFRVGVFGADDGLTAAERRGQALFNVLTRKALHTTRHGAPVPSVEVIVDERTLVGAPIADDEDLRSRICEYMDGTPLSLVTLGRYLCGAHLHRLVIDAAGEVLDAGKDVRLANRGQRRALRFRHARHCAFPGCDAPSDWTEAHHVWGYDPDPANPHGGTDMAELVPLCRFHHHRVHEGGFLLTLTPTGEVTVQRPAEKGSGRRCPVTPAKPHLRPIEPHPDVARAKARVRALVADTA